MPHNGSTSRTVEYCVTMVDRGCYTRFTASTVSTDMETATAFRQDQSALRQNPVFWAETAANQLITRLYALAGNLHSRAASVTASDRALAMKAGE